MGTWAGIFKILCVACVLLSSHTRTVYIDTLLYSENVAAASTVTEVSAVLRGDGIMGDLSIF